VCSSFASFILLLVLMQRDPTGSSLEVLRRVWAEFLPIGPDDDFFYAGGDSILAMQLVYRAREEGLVVSLKDVFSHRTVRKIASVAKRLRGDPSKRATASRGLLVGRAPIAPPQQWLFENWSDIESFNQYV
jgi:aryl carrier-like protein